MAHAYKHIRPDTVMRIFLLGPSHLKYTSHCLLSKAASYSTPLGDIDIDEDVYTELHKTGQFRSMDSSVDEAEHSLELHMPFIAHVFRDAAVTIVPIMVGALDPSSEARYGRLLAPYLADASNLFIVSSDFCHWGSRFQFTFQDHRMGPIFKSIEWLDKSGMDIIESGSPEDFTKYLDRYNNTICGRHPISILLQALKAAEGQYSLKFNAYDQSDKCTNDTDSSVSYASACVTSKLPTGS